MRQKAVMIALHDHDIIMDEAMRRDVLEYNKSDNGDEESVDEEDEESGDEDDELADEVERE